MPETFKSREYQLPPEAEVNVRFRGGGDRDHCAKEIASHGVVVGKDYALAGVATTSLGTWYVQLRGIPEWFWGVYFEGMPGEGFTLDVDELQRQVPGLIVTEDEYPFTSE